MLEIQGQLLSLSETQIISDKFRKREFVLHQVENNNGKDYDNYIKCQAIQDRCDLFNGVQKGATIKIAFNLKGFKYEKDGKTNYGTNVEAWKIEVVGSAPGHVPQQAQAQNTPPATPSDSLPF